MATNDTIRERQRLLEIAREYRQRGYEVIIEPSRDQLPEFLAPFRLDMLARNAVENVIVEVRTQESLTHAPELDMIAQALHDKATWRFELVVTNPKDRLGDAALLDRPDIAYRLREARQLSDREHGEAAFLLAWSAAEALLRRIAREEDVPIDENNVALLLKSLLTYGLLDREQYQTLQEGFQARNIIVHGYAGRQFDKEVLERLLNLADQLVEHRPTMRNS
jgi:uncharacterized protein YutE (UPF0331/DUF86 family)